MVIDSIANDPTWVLTDVQYPTGGSSHYSYHNKWRRGEVDFIDYYIVCNNKLYPSVPYTYEEIIWTDLLVTSQYNQLGETSANGMTFTYEISNIHGIEKTTSIKDQFKTDQEYNDGVLVLEMQYDLTDDYPEVPEYSIQNTYNSKTKLLESKTYYRDNIELYKQEYKYDDWGNVIWEKNSANGAETYYKYLNTTKPDDFSYPAGMTFLTPGTAEEPTVAGVHNLLRGQYMLNRNPVDDTTTTVKSSFNYDAKGNMIYSAVWDGTAKDWIVTEYLYGEDKYGLVKGILGPQYYQGGGERSFTKIEYGYNDAYPVKITKGQYSAGSTEPANFKDALGNDVGPIVLWTGYDFSTGQKNWETDGEGNLTEYAYDYLGRLSIIRYPDEDDDVAVVPGTVTKMLADGQSVSYQAPTFSSCANLGNNPVKIQYYNDKDNQTTVVNAYTLSALLDPV